MKSLLVYTLKEPECRRTEISPANFWSSDATAIAVGIPLASSMANVGPETTARLMSGPSTSRATSPRSLPVFRSSPFVAQTRRCPGLMKGFIESRVFPKKELGTTTSSISEASTASEMLFVSDMLSGKSIPGRYFSLRLVLLIASTSAASNPHSITSRPFLAMETASDEPYEPEPNTETANFLSIKDLYRPQKDARFRTSDMKPDFPITWQPLQSLQRSAWPWPGHMPQS